MNTGKFILGVGILGGVVALIANATKASAAPPPNQGSIKIILAQSNVLMVIENESGAKVLEGGVNSGYTMPLEPGAYAWIAVKTGFVSKSGTFTLTEGGYYELNITLVAVAPTTGKISITSTPPGAQVSWSIGNWGIGRTPFMSTELAPGNYTFTLTLNGYYPYTSSLTVVAGQTAVFNAILVPHPNSVVITKATVSDEFYLTLTFTSYLNQALTLWIKNTNGWGTSGVSLPAGDFVYTEMFGMSPNSGGDYILSMKLGGSNNDPSGWWTQTISPTRI